VQAINDTSDASFAASMEERLDVTRFLTHVAVENAIVEGDGIVGNQGLNNFYLYEYGAKNRFVFIPGTRTAPSAAAPGPSTATWRRTSSRAG